MQAINYNWFNYWHGRILGNTLRFVWILACQRNRINGISLMQHSHWNQNKVNANCTNCIQSLLQSCSVNEYKSTKFKWSESSSSCSGYFMQLEFILDDFEVKSFQFKVEHKVVNNSWNKVYKLISKVPQSSAWWLK